MDKAYVVIKMQGGVFHHRAFTTLEETQAAERLSVDFQGECLAVYHLRRAAFTYFEWFHGVDQSLVQNIINNYKNQYDQIYSIYRN